MSPWPSSRLFIRSVHSGFNFRRSCQHALILEVGPTTVRPTNEKKTLGLRVELASGGLAWSRTHAPLLQNKTEISLFYSWLIVFCTSLLSIAFFSSPCAPTWCSLAGTYKCLNWIELNWDGDLEWTYFSISWSRGNKMTANIISILSIWSSNRQKVSIRLWAN